MSEIAKLLAAAGLLTSGYFGASFFSSPSVGESGPVGGGGEPRALVPIEAEPIEKQQPFTFADIDNIEQAGHWESTAPAAMEHRVARPGFAASSTASSQAFQVPSISRTAERSAQGTDSRLASLEPPPLLDLKLEAKPLRRSKFPEEPPAPLSSQGGDWGDSTSAASSRAFPQKFPSQPTRIGRRR